MYTHTTFNPFAVKHNAGSAWAGSSCCVTRKAFRCALAAGVFRRCCCQLRHARRCRCILHSQPPDPHQTNPLTQPPPSKQISNYRKEIAELLKSGKQDYARIRVEAVIRECFALQARLWFRWGLGAVDFVQLCTCGTSAAASSACALRYIAPVPTSNRHNQPANRPRGASSTHTTPGLWDPGALPGAASGARPPGRQQQGDPARHGGGAQQRALRGQQVRLAPVGRGGPGWGGVGWVRAFGAPAAGYGVGSGCCPVLCCAVRCSAVQCGAVLGCAVLCGSRVCLKNWQHQRGEQQQQQPIHQQPPPQPPTHHHHAPTPQGPWPPRADGAPQDVCAEVRQGVRTGGLQRRDLHQVGCDCR